MARTIPLIRAAVLFPMLRWLQAQDQSGQDWLAHAGLAPLSAADRERPIPLLKVFELFRRLAAQEGPDACARLISVHSLEDLGVFGSLIRDARTPREALARAVRFLPRYSTHEVITLHPVPDGLRLQAGWSLHLDQEMAHLTQGFTAALIFSLCIATNRPAASPRCMKIRPHPLYGIDHLRMIFGPGVAASNEAVLSIDVDDRVLDAPLAFNVSAGFDMPPPSWTLPQGTGSFGASVRLALDALTAEPSPRIEHVATLAGMRSRSMQRMLTNEGTSFRALLDASRRSRTLHALQDVGARGHPNASDLGFSGQSALARAVRKWTGMTPKSLLRKDASLGGANPDSQL